MQHHGCANPDGKALDRRNNRRLASGKSFDECKGGKLLRLRVWLKEIRNVIAGGEYAS